MLHTKLWSNFCFYFGICRNNPQITNFSLTWTHIVTWAHIGYRCALKMKSLVRKLRNFSYVSLTWLECALILWKLSCELRENHDMRTQRTHACMYFHEKAKLEVTLASLSDCTTWVVKLMNVIWDAKVSVFHEPPLKTLQYRNVSINTKYIHKTKYLIHSSCLYICVVTLRAVE